MAFTVITAGMKRAAAVLMANLRHVNYGNTLNPVNSAGTAVDNTIDLGATGTRWANIYGYVHKLTTGLGTGSATPTTNLPVYSKASKSDYLNHAIENTHATGTAGFTAVGAQGSAGAVTAIINAKPSIVAADVGSLIDGVFTGLRCYKTGLDAVVNDVSVSTDQIALVCHCATRDSGQGSSYGGPLGYNGVIITDPLRMMENGGGGVTNGIYPTVSGLYLINLSTTCTLNFQVMLRKNSAGNAATGTQITESPFSGPGLLTAGTHRTAWVAQFYIGDYLQVFVRTISGSGTVNGGNHVTSILVSKIGSV